MTLTANTSFTSSLMLNRLPLHLATLAAVLSLGGCASVGRSLPSAGPLASEMSPQNLTGAAAAVALVDLDEGIANRARSANRRPLFSDAFGSAPTVGHLIGLGDVLEVSIWEAPPAVLFGSGSAIDARSLASGSVRASVLPEQVVGTSGTINMPFAGPIPAADRTTQQIEEEIAGQLKSKANDPQVLVRLLRNVSSTVTVVGEVASSTRMPLTPRGERLLDALAAAGGTRQPVGKVSVQLTRETRTGTARTAQVVTVPLDTVISDPAQNIALQPGDVVTILHQSNSLMLLGATTRNEELNFETQGITLAQALARAGGLQDQRANPEAVFIFRFEEPAVLGDAKPARTTADGRVPVIYRANLRDPATFFTAQGFPMRNKDILYVANAPAAELQKFLNIVSSVVLPTVTLRSLSGN